MLSELRHTRQAELKNKERQEMRKLTGHYTAIRKMTEAQIEKWSAELIDILREALKSERGFVKDYVENIKRLNPGLTSSELAYNIISRRTWKAAGVGALCSVGGILTLPITMPMELYYCFRIQARMVMAIACSYGWNLDDEDFIADILLVMGGVKALADLKVAGIGLGNEFAKRAVQKYVTRDVMKKINKVVSRKIITKAGEKSATSFVKLVPLVGAPIGFTVQFVGTKAMGNTALAFYGS